MNEFDEFLLEIVDAHPGYKVRATTPHATKSHALALDVDGLSSFRSVLSGAVLRSVTRRLETTVLGPTDLQAYGRRIYSSVFNGAVGRLFTRSYFEATANKRGLRIKLRIPSKLDRLPWELLYSDEIRDYLSLSALTPLVRYLPVNQSAMELQIDPPIRILLILASPIDLPELNISREGIKISAAIEKLQRQGLVDLDTVQGADTLVEIQNRLRAKEFHILHFVGHGTFDAESQESVLAMENEHRRQLKVSGSYLARLARDHGTIRLALLNACEGAMASESDPLNSVAASLVNAGMPATIAMQYEISDTAAIHFSSQFYSALAANFPLDAAVAEARKAICRPDMDSVDWVSPVAFMSIPQGRLFKLKSPTVHPVSSLVRRIPTPASMVITASAGRPADHIYSIIIHPLERGTIIVGTNTGIYQSNDRGYNWKDLSFALTARIIRQVVFGEAGKMIYVVTEGGAVGRLGGVSRSSDEGASWISSNTGLEGYDVHNLICPEEFKPLLAGTTGGVFKGILSGGRVTWFRAGFWRTGLSISTVRFLLVDPLNADIIFAGTTDGVFKSTDTGDHWSPASAGIPYGTVVNCIAADRTDSQILYLGTERGIYRTTNGGMSWLRSDVGLATGSNVQTIVVSDNIRGLLFIGTRYSGIFTSIDFGMSWQLSNEGLATNTVYSLAVDREEPDLLYAGTNKGVFRSFNKGKSWRY